MPTVLDAATLAGFNALARIDGRKFAHGGKELVGIPERLNGSLSRFGPLAVEASDEEVLHFRRNELEASGWTLADGLIVTSEGRNYRVTKVFPDYSEPIARLQVRVTQV